MRVLLLFFLSKGYENSMLCSEADSRIKCGQKSRFSQTICYNKFENIRSSSYFTTYRWYTNASIHTWIWTWIKGKSLINEKGKQQNIHNVLISWWLDEKYVNKSFKIDWITMAIFFFRTGIGLIAVIYGRNYECGRSHLLSSWENMLASWA